jgi:O-antigen/teichoic acid export membrane protein
MSRLKQNILFNVSGKTLILLVNLFAARAIFHDLGSEQLGIVYFIIAFDAVLLSAIDKGVSLTTIREVSTRIASDRSYVIRYLQTWSGLAWLAFLALAAVVYFSAPLLVDRWINFSTIDSTTAVAAIRLLGCASLLSLPTSLYISIFNGLQRMAYSNLVEVLAAVSEKGGIILILTRGGTFFDIVYWISFCKVLIVFTGAFVSGFLLSFRAVLPLIKTSIVRKNLSFALQMTYISILGIFQKQVDKITISKMLPIGLLGYYSFAFNTVSRGILLSQAISTAAYPNLCDTFTNKDQAASKRLFHKLHEFICFLNVPVFVFLPFVSRPLFSYVFDPSVAESLQWPVVLLCLGFYMNGTMMIPYRMLLAAGRPEIAVRQNLIAFLVTVPLTVFMTMLWRLNGAALGWISYFLVAYAITVPAVFRHCLQEKTASFFRTLATIVALASLTYGIAILAMAYWAQQTLFASVALYLAASLVFAVSAYYFAGHELRATANRYFSKGLEMVLENPQQ